MVVVSIPTALSALAQVGGGGAGGGFGGGHGSATGDLIAAIAVGALVLFSALYYAYFLWRRARSGTRTWRTWRRRSERDASIRRELAAMADDDPGFDPATIVPECERLVAGVQRAWNDGDRAALRRRLGADLYDEWAWHLRDFEYRGWRARSVLTSEPRVEIVGATNVAGEHDDVVVVYVRACMKRWVDRPEGRFYRERQVGPWVRLAAYWTLGRRHGRWVLVSVEGRKEGRHNVTDPVVASPDRDPGLADEARVALASGDTTSAGGRVASLASTSFADDAHASALDLALVDDRFSPDVIAAEVRATVAAWAIAVDGPIDDLARRATDTAADHLLYADSRAEIRTVVRGITVESLRVERIDDASDPPRIEIVLRYRGRWYRERRASQETVDGSRDEDSRREDHWTFELVDHADAHGSAPGGGAADDRDSGGGGAADDRDSGDAAADVDSGPVWRLVRAESEPLTWGRYATGRMRRTLRLARR